MVRIPQDPHPVPAALEAGRSSTEVHVSETWLRVLTVLGLGALGGSLVAGALAERDGAGTGTRPGRLAGVIQFGIVALGLAGLASSRETSLARLGGAGALLAHAWFSRALVVRAAATGGTEAMRAAGALAVLGGLGITWSVRLGAGAPRTIAIQAVAFAAGAALGSVGGSALGDALRGRPGAPSAALRSPWAWWVACVALVAAPLAFGRFVHFRDGTGLAATGIRAGPVYFQPAELAYLIALPTWAALLLSRSAGLLRRGVLVLGRGVVLPDPVVPLLAAVAFAVGFALPLKMAGEHGLLVLGAALLLTALLLVSERPSLVLGSALVAMVGGAFLAHSNPRVMHRLQDFAGLGTEPVRGEQVEQALLAVGASRLTGTGVGLGRPRDVYAARTDFPVAPFVEELGLGGLAVLLASLASLGSSLLGSLSRKLARGEIPPAAAAVSACLFMAVLLQMAWSVGMNMGLLPVMGIACPFLSMSGTAVLAATAAVAASIRLAWQGARA